MFFGCSLDVIGLPCGVLPCTKGKTGHLSGDTDTALVQDVDGVLVTLAFFTKQVGLGDDNVVEVEHASAARPDTELLFLFRNREAGGTLLNNECGDTLVSLARVQVGEDNEETRLHGIGNPHLGSIELVAVRGLLGLGLQRKGVRAGRRLGETEGAEGAGAELGQPSALGVGVAIPHDRSVDQGVVDIDHDADARVDAGQLLDRHDGRGEVHAGTAVLLGNLNAHETLLEELFHQCRVHGLGLVHVPNLRADLLLGELGDRVGHQRLGLGEVGDRRRGEI